MVWDGVVVGVMDYGIELSRVCYGGSLDGVQYRAVYCLAFVQEKKLVG